MSFQIGEEVQWGPELRGRVLEVEPSTCLIQTPRGHFRVAAEWLCRVEPLLHVTMTREAAENATKALHAAAARQRLDPGEDDWLQWLVGRIEAAKRAEDGVAHD